MSELVFLIEQDIDGGFVARALGEAIFTQGETREELVQNLKDAVRCHFDSPEKCPKVLRLHYVHDEVLSL